MRIHWLQHVPFEGLGSIGPWLQERGYTVTCTRFWAGDAVPPAYQIDGAIVMGGPMNIYEEELYPWLADEKRFLNAAIESGKPCLGICLGAQLLADVLGGPVTKNPAKEIGWMPVRLTGAGTRALLTRGLPETFTPLHWHGDTFAIPPGAVHLAETDACKNQAFSFEDFVLGLQFHLEATQESCGGLLENCADELVDAPYIQDASTIRAGLMTCAPAARAIMETLLGRLFGQGR